MSILTLHDNAKTAASHGMASRVMLERVCNQVTGVAQYPGYFAPGVEGCVQFFGVGA